MIDYFAHVAALRVCLSALKSKPPADPAHPKDVTAALSDANSQPGSAILGALVDHLLQYSESTTSVEIGILTQAAALFQNAKTILAQISATRAGLEAGLTTPAAPGVVAGYNTALASLSGIATQVQNLQTGLQAFQATFSGNWMAAVGQQQDKPVPQWAWRDVFLARRTTAFVANAQALATTPRQRAFALGTLAGAAGNFLGSGYLNAVVGGPRRSHELRHRLAAYSVGAWLRDNEPQYAETLATIQTALTFGQSGTATLPADLKTIIHGALQKAYPSGTAPLPDVDTGYGNLLKHLRLLGEFDLPPVPAPLNNTLTSEVLHTDGAPFVLGYPNANPTGSKLGTNNPGIGTRESAGAVCEELLLWLIWPPQWVAGLQAMAGDGSGAGEFTLDQLQLQTMSQSPAALAAINNFYSMSLSFWQALAAARSALVLRGLLYPDADDLSNPTFTQFLSIPLTGGHYPLLPMPGTDDGTGWPTTAVEKPATSPSPYAAAASPLTFLTGPTHSVSAQSGALWIAMIEHAGTTDRPGSDNPNLDSDRGFSARCWALAPGSSITSQPVVTNTLSYTAI